LKSEQGAESECARDSLKVVKRRQLTFARASQRFRRDARQQSKWSGFGANKSEDTAESAFY
jgi:hypothetical protein